MTDRTKVYKGIMDPDDQERKVLVLAAHGKPFATPLHLTAGTPGFPNHSPDGHNWGYTGSGPAQLAHDLLYDVFSVRIPAAVYQTFKFRHIAGLETDDWEMSEQDVADKALPIFAKKGFNPVAAQQPTADDPPGDVPKP